MRRIVVFDSGWGGELVADFLARELLVVEVVRVIDWARKSYNGEELNLDGAIECLAPYVGNVDAIVLGGYTAGVMRRALERAFPGQKFVAPGINYDKVLRARQYPENVAVLMNGMLRGSGMFRELRARLPYSTLILPECTGWEQLIDENLMTREIVRTELAWDFETCPEETRRRRKVPGSGAGAQSVVVGRGSNGGVDSTARSIKGVAAGRGAGAAAVLASGAASAPTVSPAERRVLMRAIQNFGSAAERASREEQRETVAVARAQREYLARDTSRVQVRPDLVLLLNTHFWEIKSEIEQALGWKVRVLDFREKLLHDVCAALKLRGVDGNRAK